MDALAIEPRRREYIRACLANREKLFEKPRINISTIHRSKGGEADNVALAMDLSTQPWNQLATDEEQRVLYVGLTRARKTLTLIQPKTAKHYRL
jgi:superfamily I DNA/RNA helicase